MLISPMQTNELVDDMLEVQHYQTTLDISQIRALISLSCSVRSSDWLSGRWIPQGSLTVGCAFYLTF